jgi:hypothetical protein
MYPRLFLPHSLEVLEKGKVVLRQRDRREAFQEVKILFRVSLVIHQVIRLKCECFPGSGYMWLLSVKAAIAAAGLELKFFIIEGGKTRICITYLLLSPRELAFELFLLVEQGLVLPAQSSKAFDKLRGEPWDAVMRLFRHGVVSNKTRMLLRRSKEAALIAPQKRIADGGCEGLTEARQRLKNFGRDACVAPHLVSATSHSGRKEPRMVNCLVVASQHCAMNCYVASYCNPYKT